MSWTNLMTAIVCSFTEVVVPDNTDGGDSELDESDEMADTSKASCRYQIFMARYIQACFDYFFVIFILK